VDDGRDRDEAWLGALLEAAADGYEPDAERLRALVEARIADGAEERAETGAAGATRAGPGYGADARVRGRRRPTRPVGRLGLLGRLGVAGIPAGIALTAIGAAAALAIGTTVAVTAHGGRSTTIAIVAPGTGTDGAPTMSQSPSTPGTRPPTGAGGNRTASPSGAASSNTATSPVSASAPTGGSATGSAAYSAVASLDATSNPNWAQLDVNLTVREPLTALEITITVAAGPGVSETGEFDSGASGLFTPAAASGPDGSITYTFRLNTGQTVPSGGIEFAAQFNHAATGWAASADRYRVSAGPASAAPVVIQGSY